MVKGIQFRCLLKVWQNGVVQGLANLQDLVRGSMPMVVYIQLLHMRNGREYSMFTPQANMKITLTEITSGNSGNGNFVIPHFYISACSNSVQCVKLHSIIMSILLYHFKQLTECIPEVEHIEAAKVNSKKRRKLTSISRIHIDYHALPTSQGIFTCSSEL